MDVGVNEEDEEGEGARLSDLGWRRCFPSSTIKQTNQQTNKQIHKQANTQTKKQTKNAS